METDRIEKKILLQAPPERVWRALSDATEFGSWFGMKLDGPFEPGTSVRGIIVPTSVDAEVARAQKPYEGTPVEMAIDRMEPERLFSFRWHPGAVDPELDYSVEPMTLVVFEMQEQPDGVLLTITESGFDRIPLARRAKAFASNDGGWTMVLQLIQEHLLTHAR